MTNLLTLKEVATYMGFKSSTYVKKMVKAGKLKAIKVGRYTKIPDWEYERFIAECMEEIENDKVGEAQEELSK